MGFEYIHKGKISVQGTISGIVAGLVAITPAAGFVDFQASLIIGGLSAVICYLAVTYLKELLKYDDALDVFGLHGVGGIVGAILVGVFANPEIGGAAGALYGDEKRIFAQIISVVVTLVYSGIVTLILLMIIRTIMGLRVDPYVEYYGLDLAHHGETIVEFEAGLPAQLPAEAMERMGLADTKPDPKTKSKARTARRAKDRVKAKSKTSEIKKKVAKKK
jgi:Amt family ammonium transporter